jgi:signal transduction histidine kinase
LSKPKRVSRRSSRALLDGLPDPVLLVESGVIVDANDVATKEFGGGASLAGVPLHEVLDDGEWERLELLDAQRTRGWTIPAMCRLRFRGPAGAMKISDVRFRRLSSSLMVLTARDAALMTRAEGLVARLAQLPSGMDGADALLDASEPVFGALGWVVAFTEILEGGSRTLRILAKAGDPVGDYGRTLVGRVVPLAATPVLAEVVRTGAALFLDNLPTTQKGTIRDAVALSDSMDRAGVARSAWCPIHAQGKVTHLLSATGADITEHDFVAIQVFSSQLGAAVRLRALRMEMVHRERLAAVGEMAAVLAHEVRNPLGVMFTALSTLSRAEPGKRGDWQALLDILQEEADRLQRLVTDLLEFASASTPVLEPVALRPIALDVVEAAQHDASFLKAQPTTHVDVAAGLLVRTDRVLFRRVLLNVVLNAFQHVTRGGRVAVVAEPVDGEVALTVHNDGPSIAAATAKRVFEPFFTTQPTGTGLGLAIVHRLCTDIGARVDVVPVDDGATFRILLPKNP